MATVTSNTSNHRPKDVASPKSWQRWTGRVLSALPVLMLLMSASMKLMHAPQFVEAWTNKFGWQETSLTTIGVLELACTAVYLVPRTAFVGAILLGAYLGGAVATHARIGDAFAVPVVLGVFLWVGLALREERVGSLSLGRRFSSAE